MTAISSLLEDPDDTREEIMRATYLALCEHGYADLTIQRIGEAFPKSKSLIYHHYDGKDELLLEFLGFILDRFEADLPEDSIDDPAEQLRSLLDHMLATSLPAERREFTRAMVNLRAQAAHDDRYREQFTRHDRFFRARIADIVTAGVDDGTFAAVDPDTVATFLTGAITGAMTQRVTNDEPTAAAVRDQLEAYLRTYLSVER